MPTPPLLTVHSAPIPGTPFSTPAYDMALNGTWLFATDGSNIDSFSIAANGALNANGFVRRRKTAD